MSVLSIKARANRVAALEQLAARTHRTDRPAERVVSLGDWATSLALVFDYSFAQRA